MVAIDLELGRSAVETLFPIAIVSAPHAGGRDPDHDWETQRTMLMTGSLHMSRCPENKNGKPILARAVELMTEWFAKNDPPAPQERKHP